MELSITICVMPSPQGRSVNIPKYATDGSAGVDLEACIDAPIQLAPGDRCRIPTGIAVELPGPWVVGLIYPRSGLATKYGIVLSNCVGVIDSDYRGEVVCGMVNQSQENYIINPGDRIAQLVFTPVYRATFEVAQTLEATVRGSGGFGSTGV